MQEVMQKIAFVPKPALDLEQIRLRSILLGKIVTEKFSSLTEIKSKKLATSPSKTTLSAKEQFAKIRMFLNKGNKDATNSA